ncbi:MAG: DUF3795 domain-containing protein [Bacillota bacterium]|nr:DUF3795 domain-containing protein [Bacillota bacterium]
MNTGDGVLGFCGLYCGGCTYYQNTMKGIKTKVDENLYTECLGCNSGTTTPWCSDCQIKNCNREKGIRYCLECSTFPCEILNYFMNDEKYPYHKEVPENMKRLQEIGLNKWIEEQDSKYTCKKCGEKFDWFENQCKHCE